MDLAKLQMFVKIAELGSLSKASAQYDMGASTLSRQMSAFEAEYKGRLFLRTGRGLVLTELGQKILPRARELLADADRLAAEIRGSAGVPRGTVRLAVVPSVTAPLVARIILEAQRRYPEVTLHVTEAFSGQIEEWLALGRVDLGFVLRPSANSVTEKPLARSQLCVVGPAGDSLTAPDEVDFSCLDGQSILLPSQPSNFRSFLEQIARRNGVTFKVAAEIDSVAIMKEVVAAGVGYALLSASTVQQEVQQQRLSIARLINPKVSRQVYLSTTAQKSGDLATREISRLIRQVSEELLGVVEEPSTGDAAPDESVSPAAEAFYVPNPE
ncbi:LysR family transcriptional regulator [Massilia putida]|uniref:LysR family transcriptional regulator n=1 Tax=Massilia putida TaxID=1141883 RepID=UPI0009519670|nr:LysR family transcriptional regulator [Massilia putida]